MQRDFNKIHFSLSKDLIIPENRKESKLKLSRPLAESPEAFGSLCGYIVDDLALPPQLKWSAEDVLFWIDSLGFPQYRNTFKANFIDGRTLLLVDASALVKMNIRDFDHIKAITKDIRKMYKIELEKFNKSISLTPKDPDAHYKFHKVSSGIVYEMCSRTDFFKKMKLMKEVQVPLNHFERLHQWLKHIPDFQHIRVGGIKRINLYFVKSNPNHDETAVEKKCTCTMPPCDCDWSQSEKRKPWKLSFLVKVDDGKYDQNVCEKLSVLNLLLIKD